jgi:hypothetical protein
MSQQQIDDKKNLQNIGFFYADFTYERRWFQSVSLLRKLATAAIFGLGSDPYEQITLLIITTVSYIVALFKLSPYKVGYWQVIPEAIANVSCKIPS